MRRARTTSRGTRRAARSSGTPGTTRTSSSPNSPSASSSITTRSSRRRPSPSCPRNGGSTRHAGSSAGITSGPSSTTSSRDWRARPFMPVEFSVAAYRFGHSMVRGEYELNAEVQEIPIFAKPPAEDLRGFRALPAGHVIQWARFFEFSGSRLEVQPSRKIDTKLAFGLSILPEAVARGIQALALPSGQTVARAIGLPEDLILHARDLKSLPKNLIRSFGEDTPLFFYVLKEAEVLSKGQRLGPVGGRIVAEVLIGLLRGDPFSFLSMQPNWRPKPGEFGARKDGEFTVADLLRFAGVTIG